jgi:tol-pal system protein YbgF
MNLYYNPPVNFKHLILSAIVIMGLMALSPQTFAVSLEDRVNQLERLLNSQTVLDREQQFIQMQNDIQTLRGEMEVLSHQLEQIEKQQQDMYLDIVQQLQHSSSLVSSPSEPEKPATVTEELPAIPTETATAESVVPTETNHDEAEAYQRAFDVLQQGQYGQAIIAFKAQLTQYPQGQHAEDTQYWLAETYYALKKFDSALKTFGKFLEKYPKSPKYAHAQLKIGYIYYELTDYIAARSILEQVKENYPATATAHLAEERLHLMRKEGL